MGHSGIDAMRKLLFKKLVCGIDSIKIEDLHPCDFCKQGKLPQGPHPVADMSSRGTRLLDLVVVDLASLDVGKEAVRHGDRGYILSTIFRGPACAKE